LDLRHHARCAVPLLALVAVAALSGCADISQKFAATASQAPYIGLSPDAPARPAVQGAYPAVHDMPAERNSIMLTGVEQQKLESDLAVARDRQQDSVGLPKSEPKKNAKPSAPQKVVPVSSRGSIY
jgi:hypothetical protein